jgi:hypothetical protein
VEGQSDQHNGSTAEQLAWEANRSITGKKEHFRHNPDLEHLKRQMLEESR